MNYFIRKKGVNKKNIEISSAHCPREHFKTQLIQEKKIKTRRIEIFHL